MHLRSSLDPIRCADQVFEVKAGDVPVQDCPGHAEHGHVLVLREQSRDALLVQLAGSEPGIDDDDATWIQVVGESSNGVSEAVLIALNTGERRSALSANRSDWNICAAREGFGTMPARALAG